MGEALRHNGRTVVVLEDDAELANIVCDVYRTLGAKCIPVTSFEALRQAAERVLDADLVLLDINLGSGESGVDAWRWLRHGRYAGRVVFLTGHAVTNPQVKSAAALSAAPILSKPVSFKTLEGLLQVPDEPVANPDPR